MLKLNYFRCCIALAFLLFASIRAQEVNLNCLFYTEFNQYTCLITNVIVADNEHQNFFIGGNHSAGRSNNDVERVEVMFSQTPFVVTQLFTVFPNVINFQMNTAALTRFQPNAFVNARELTTVSIKRNNVHQVPSRLFSASTRLRSIDMHNNQIEVIHEDAFEGLASLQLLYLDQNRIRHLPANVFRSLRTLRTLFLQNNLIERLDGRLFAGTPSIFQVDIDNNQVNAVGETIVDGLNVLFVLSLEENLCVSQFWAISGAVTLDTIRADLRNCFTNFKTT